LLEGSLIISLRELERVVLQLELRLERVADAFGEQRIVRDSNFTVSTISSSIASSLARRPGRVSPATGAKGHLTRNKLLSRNRRNCQSGQHIIEAPKRSVADEGDTLLLKWTVR
jgi:hypothetical protein